MVLTRVCWLTNPDDVVSRQLDVWTESARDYWKHRGWNTQLPDVEQVRSPITSNVVGLFCFQPIVDFKGLTETDFKFWHTFFDTPLTHHSSTKWTMMVRVLRTLNSSIRTNHVRRTLTQCLCFNGWTDEQSLRDGHPKTRQRGFVWMVEVFGLNRWIEELSSIGWDTLFSSHYVVRVIQMLGLLWVVSHTSPNVSGSLWGSIVFPSFIGIHVDNGFFLLTQDTMKSILS
jgi:hypothetical protein